MELYHLILNAFRDALISTLRDNYTKHWVVVGVTDTSCVARQPTRSCKLTQHFPVAAGHWNAAGSRVNGSEQKYVKKNLKKKISRHDGPVINCSKENRLLEAKRMYKMPFIIRLRVIHLCPVRLLQVALPLDAHTCLYILI